LIRRRYADIGHGTHVSEHGPIVEHEQRVHVERALSASRDHRRRAAHDDDAVHDTHDLANGLKHLVRPDSIHFRYAKVRLGELVLRSESGGGRCATFAILVFVLVHERGR
jgi:hypothetical protein